MGIHRPKQISRTVARPRAKLCLNAIDAQKGLNTGKADTRQSSTYIPNKPHRASPRTPSRQ